MSLFGVLSSTPPSVRLMVRPICVFAGALGYGHGRGFAEVCGDRPAWLYDGVRAEFRITAGLESSVVVIQ